MTHYLCFGCGKSVYHVKDEGPVFKGTIRCLDCQVEYERQTSAIRELQSRLHANDFHRRTGTR